MELPDVVMLSHIFGHSSLYGSGNEEILLLQAQFLPRIMIIIGIEHLNDISCQVFLFHRFLIIALIK